MYLTIRNQLSKPSKKLEGVKTDTSLLNGVIIVKVVKLGSKNWNLLLTKPWVAESSWPVAPSSSDSQGKQHGGDGRSNACIHCNLQAAMIDMSLLA
jgi:hypothetical protein